ncbi:RecF/RecN/SMC [Cokeromyces recurvatus]|uniref:RecF/RecN/SMC n=1 Tax=Cokeromyces recurvatus TaxID=90255 RepID=UPI002220AFD2|nr:RecF/RecN/SMC [Cokeromyces recurvatus]KAI7901410.1 RecF/RecN/SMC [Cokeromyces recurvatus]
MGRLVRIEVENFKSYKGHQTIGPFHQFTSVIGPNGSGKSNLMDAISFVLGVHSSHLRSQNLKDMIYRSEALRQDDDVHSTTHTTRSPRKASVTAVYENNQGREVRFIRTINHNGLSEYRINDKVVQYSQYNAELEKENILVKAKNFLVFQGDVESVASQNPKDLTRLIEQISGSWEYRDEYDELKQKMEEAIENSAHTFNRKRSVASEIKQYEEQKAEAEKFEELVANKRNLLIQYLLWKLYHIEQKSKTLEEEGTTKNMNKDNLQYEVAELENSFKKAREDKALIHREKIKCELHIRKINREIDEQLPTSISYKEKISHLEKKIKHTEQSIERVKRDGQQQEQVVSSLEKDLQLLDYAEQQFNNSIPTSGLTNGPTLTGAQLMDYERRKQEVSIKAVEEQHQLQQLQRQHRTEKQRMDDKKSKMDQLREAESKALDDLRQANEEKSALTLDAESLSEQLNVRQAELKKLELERIAIHQREVELNEKLQVVLNKLMEASVTQQESEKDIKFNESVTVLKQIYPNVHGKLSDLCRPNQRKYDTAVATVLGRNMDAIVVEDEQTATECIQYMREQHIGTATFLPMHSLSLPPINDRYRNLVKGSRLAFDVMKFDKQYENVVQYACGSTLICDNLNIAKHICYEMNENVRAVTLDGAVIHQNGLMTGGQSSVQSTKKWQQSEIDELMRERNKYLTELNNISKNKRMGSAEDSARNDCSSFASQLNTLNEELTTLTRRIEGLQGTIEDTRRKLTEAIQPYEQSKATLDQLEANIKTIEAQIHQVEDHIFEDFCAQINVINIREYEASQFGVSDEVTERRAQFTTQRSRLDTQLTFEKEQLGELVERLRKLEASLEADKNAKSKLEADLAGMAGKTENLKTKLQSYQVDLEKQTKLEEKKQVDINDISRALEAKGRNVDEILREYRAIESEINKVQAERIAIFRKCKLEGIHLPLSRGSMDDIIIEDTRGDAIANANMDTDASSVSETSSVTDDHNSMEYTSSSDMDLDAPTSQLSIQSTDWEVEVDFSQVGDNQREDDSPAMDRQFQDKIKQYTDEIEQMAPNMKAIDRLEGVTERLKVAEQEFNSARAIAKTAKEQFNAIKQKRYSLFYDAFSHISEKIDTVYKDLTKNPTFPLGGTAYLSMEDSDEPYLEGIKYHAMPPMKRFRDMEQLSGGEKSVAALALLFAIHSYKPSPFFVLDEVDAALDNTNVTTVATYIREHATPNFQFIVISLKHRLYEKAQSLVGIYRDQEINSSKTMTLMLDQYQN